MKNLLKLYPILFLTFILIGGFALACAVFVWTGGDVTGKGYFSDSSAFALGVILLTYVGAYLYYKWTLK